MRKNYRIYVVHKRIWRYTGFDDHSEKALCRFRQRAENVALNKFADMSNRKFGYSPE